jgi:erythromycin esterase
MNLICRLLVILFCLSPTLPKAQNVTLISNELKAKAHPLILDAKADQYGDLMFLKEILKDKHIIGAGEATHGCTEFFRFKQRLYEFLVAELGVRTFTIEESYSTGLLVNSFIHGETDSSAEQIVSHMSLLWKTHEMCELIAWMKTYNDNHEDKISFFGFDMHDPKLAVHMICNYLAKVDSLSLPTVKRQLHPMEDNDLLNHRASKKEYTGNCENIDSVSHLLNRNRESYILKEGLKNWGCMQHLVQVLAQCIEVYRSGDEDFFRRDPYMAANIGWIDSTQAGNRPLMVWAHNYHIQIEKRLPNMGSRLRNRYQEKYYALGFFFNQGSYTATSVKSYRERYTLKFSFPEAPVGTLSNVMKETKLNNAFIDFKQDHLSPSTYSWLLGRHRFWSAGYRGTATAQRLLLHKRKLSEDFDGLVFFETVHNSQNYTLREL